jgi:hypothetical protein
MAYIFPCGVDMVTGLLDIAVVRIGIVMAVLIVVLPNGISMNVTITRVTMTTFPSVGFAIAMLTTVMHMVVMMRVMMWHLLYILI